MLHKKYIYLALGMLCTTLWYYAWANRLCFQGLYKFGIRQLSFIQLKYMCSFETRWSFFDLQTERDREMKNIHQSTSLAEMQKVDMHLHVVYVTPKLCEWWYHKAWNLHSLNRYIPRRHQRTMYALQVTKCTKQWSVLNVYIWYTSLCSQFHKMPLKMAMETNSQIRSPLCLGITCKKFPEL